MANKPVEDPRVYLAAERTFLAWLRTGLGLMGVGLRWRGLDCFCADAS
jgi:putative membrane protein